MSNQSFPKRAHPNEDTGPQTARAVLQALVSSNNHDGPSIAACSAVSEDVALSTGGLCSSNYTAEWLKSSINIADSVSTTFPVNEYSVRMVDMLCHEAFSVAAMPGAFAVAGPPYRRESKNVRRSMVDFSISCHHLSTIDNRK